MTSLSIFGRLLERRAQRKGREAQRRAFDSLSDKDLADMGVKRYQLGQ